MAVDYHITWSALHAAAFCVQEDVQMPKSPYNACQLCRSLAAVARRSALGMPATIRSDMP
jgi:hypothetical protein